MKTLTGAEATDKATRAVTMTCGPLTVRFLWVAGATKGTRADFAGRKVVPVPKMRAEIQDLEALGWTRA